MGTKNNPGEFDCYDNAEDDEPIFVLLARDPVAAEVVRYWTWRRWLLKSVDGTGAGAPTDYDDRLQCAEALACADDMEEWRVEHRP